MRKQMFVLLLLTACGDGASEDFAAEAPAPLPAVLLDDHVAQAVDSPHLPILWIETGGRAIVPDVKSDARLRVIEDHDGTLTGLPERPASFEGRIGIEIRGNSSLMFEKASYGLETRDAAGKSLDVALLGMPAESDWVLYAPFTDKTLVRDKVAYDLGAQLGRYQPRSRFVELFLDGQYDGVYVVIEKIKRGKQRVDITKVAPDAAAGDVTGGYIVKMDGNQASFWEPHVPKAKDLTPEQTTYLTDYLSRFETLMTGPGFVAPGYASMIDVPSFIDYLIITELSRNIDGYRKSTYMAKKRDADGGLAYMGPLWDYNIAFGNADYCEGAETTGFQYNRDACTDVLAVPTWWGRLMADPPFANAVRCRWSSLRQGVLSNASIHARIEGYVEQLEAAEPRDNARWGTIGRYIWPNPFVGETYEQEIDHLLHWIDARAAWLDANLPGTCT